MTYVPFEYTPVYLILACIFCHMISDYWMQKACVFEKLKCKSWWKSTTTDEITQLRNKIASLEQEMDHLTEKPSKANAMRYCDVLREISDLKFKISGIESMYEKDYIVGLVLHSIMWSMVTFLPFIPVVTCRTYLIIVVINAILHGVIDHIKCNLYAINLTTDQFLHFVQIVATLCIIMN